MKLYSFISKDIPKSSVSKAINSCLDSYTVSKQIGNKFKYNRLFLLWWITVFLLGIYLLVAYSFLNISSSISEKKRYKYKQCTPILSLHKDALHYNSLSKNKSNLNSIPIIYQPDFKLNLKNNKFWVYSHVSQKFLRGFDLEQSNSCYFLLVR